MQLSKQLDIYLLDLAWSLWTELGIAGVKRNHQQILIWIEELILFTSILAEIDPRLRDESLDWCSQFHRFISISRLKSLMKDFEGLARESYSKYASTLNAISNVNWPVYIESVPIKIILSRKSVLRPYASSALLNLRARSIFGTGARADLITFFLVHRDSDFSISEAAEIGYSKRNLAEVLDDLHFVQLFDRFMQGNQQRYRLAKDSPILKILSPLPEYAPGWRLIFQVLLTLRACIKNSESHSESTKVVEIRNCLAMLENPLKKLGLLPPPFSNDFSLYLHSFREWILEWVAKLSEGKF